MVKNICKDQFFLRLKSIDLKKEESNLIVDLTDTLKANLNRCVGMAFNMIGVNKRVIACYINNNIKVMINPIILEKYDEYLTEEGCLSLEGLRKTKRYNKIKITYFDLSFNKKTEIYTKFNAQIIQHEMDHLEGIII